MRAARQFLFELIERVLLGLSVNFDFPARQISRITDNTEPLGCAQSEPPIADALNSTSNDVVFRSNHDTGRFALCHALIPPTTLATV